MDAEDEEALTASSPPPPAPSPPLQQHLIHDTEVVEEEGTAVAQVKEEEQEETVVFPPDMVEEATEETVVAVPEETQIVDLANEGDGGMQVMMDDDRVGDEVVEKGNGSGHEDDGITDGTEVGNVAKVEEEGTRLEIVDGEDKVVEVAEQMEEVANEAGFTEEREEKEHEHEKDEEGEEADVGCGMANGAALMEEHQHEQAQEHDQEEADVGGGGIGNEAALIEEHEEGHEQEEEQHQEEEVEAEDKQVGAGLGISNEADLMEEDEEEAEEQADDDNGITNEAALMEEHEEGQEDEDEQADSGIGIANEAALMEEHEEEQEEEEDEQEQVDGDNAIANEVALMEEHEEGQEDEEQEEEEEEAADGGDVGMGEETEEAADQSRSVSGGKRKRGSGKNSKSTGRVTPKKKMEEDVCFICFDGGDLVLCDRRGCPKAYHPKCVNHDEAFFRTKGKWNCGWHLCSNCEKNAYYMCFTCTFSLCKGCIKDSVILCVRGNKGFCESCMRTVMLIEQNNQGNMGQVDFDDRSTWEYLFKDYYVDLKEKLNLTFDELTQAKNPCKGSDVLPSREESAGEPFDANNDRASDSDSSYENVDLSRSKRRKGKKKTKSRPKGRAYSSVRGADGPSADESFEWASKELLEFVMHMRNGDKSVLSQFDVQALLLEYIKRNKLRDPRRKSQIICDARLQSLFGKPRVGHFEMLKLLESHFLLKEDSQAEDLQGSVVDTEVSHLEGDGNSDSYLKGGKDKKRKTRKKGDERGLQSNVDDYAAIDNHNVNLIYLRRNLVEELLEDTEKFHDRVAGSFVRIRISGCGQKQDLYRLVQVVGTCKAAEPYKVGKRMTDLLLEILNLNKTEIVSIDIISNQEFTEDECKRLRQSIKCGLINRLTVGDIQEKAMALQAVRVNDWLETEIVRLSHLRDRASEKGRRKELRECVEKLQLLKTPEERQRRLEEISEIHVDPKMDPNYESEEDEDEMDEKRQENYLRPRGSAAFGRRGREIISPRSVSISSDSWSGTRNYSNVNRELSRNLSNKGFSIKGDDVSTASEVLSDAQLLQGRDKGSQPNSLERQKLTSSFESGAKSNQPIVTPETVSMHVLEASAAPSSAGVAPPAIKINETEKIWHYQDPSGKVQGPFSMVQLRKWSNTGYFPADLRIWKATEKQDQSMLLTDALAGKFSKESSMVDSTLPKTQLVHDLHYSSSYSGKSPLVAQATEVQAGGRPTFDQNRASHNSLGSPVQNVGGGWRSKDNMTPLASRPSALAVEVPKNPVNGWGSDAGVRNEPTNLPSPTPQTASGGTKMQAFENEWSPTPGGPGSGSIQPGMMSASKSDKGMILNSADTMQVHPHATAVAPIVASGVDIQTAGANLQNQVVGSHNSRSEAHQGWGSGTVSKPESQAWGGTQSQTQRIEPNNPATMPAQPASHGLWVDASSVQNSASFSTVNPTGNFPTAGFPGMATSEPWRPPTSNSQPTVAAAAVPPNVPWSMGVMENQNAAWGMPGTQNINWSGSLPANMNTNWMHGQIQAPGNATPGWAAPSQAPPPANAVGWSAPGQGRPYVNANAGWVAPGQGPAPGSANPGRAASTGNPGTWGGEQGRNGDRFPSQGDRGTHGGDSGYGGKPWNRQSSFNSGGRGGSSRPPPGGQRGVCKYHESGHCKKGASCDFMHT